MKVNKRNMGYNKVPKLNNPRVVIADDHDLFSQILGMTLKEAGMEVVHVATTGREAVEATLLHNPDIVLMDIVMPEMDGLAALSILKYACPETPVFMITALADPLYLARAGELGAEGFFSKAVGSKELVNAIHDILSGGKLSVGLKLKPEPVAPSFSDNKFPMVEPQSPRRKELTEKESMILSLIASGFDNQTMLEKLHITKNTLKTHIRNIFSKLEISDRTQAAIWALQHGYGDGVPEVNRTAAHTANASHM
jgi:DNA-binding NarL/FixJ family response regulator